MGTIDLSRHGTNFAKHYDGSLLAQGQVLSDEDFNDAARMAHEDMRRTRVDVIGPAGTPDDGFRLTAPVLVGGRCSFTINPGTFYLGGLRLTLEAPEPFHLQRDWLQQTDADRPLPPAAGVTRYDMAVLECYQQPITATEDDELFEPSFGGAPPAVRTRTVRRVLIETDVQTDDCKAAWTAVQARWAALGTLGPDAELKPDATLQVTYGGAGGSADLCSPGVMAGFLGAENQAIQVRLLSGNKFVWGYDNASRIYRVLANTLGGERREIEFIGGLPKDVRSRPLAGQVIEILPWSAALANRVLANGKLDDCAKSAELTGHLAEVESSYNPTTRKLTLKPGQGVPGDANTGFGTAWKQRADKAEIVGTGQEYLFLRVWDQGEGAGASATAFVPGTPVAVGATGLSITLRGAQFPPGLHWTIAARPETANQVLPWQFDSDAGRGPQGTRRYRTPLGVLQWIGNAGTLVDDCRAPFLPLTRVGGCCRVTVGDNSTSFGHFTSINAAIKALPPSGGEVCILEGHYVENVDLVGYQHVSIHGCGRRTVVESALTPAGDGAGPVFDITRAHDISISDLAIIAHGTQPGILSVGAGQTPTDVRLSDLEIEAGPRCAIELQGGRFVVIQRCDIFMRNQTGPWPAVYSGCDDVLIERNHIEANPPKAGADTPPTQARGGLQIGGGSSRVRIVNNLIERGIGNGITLGSLVYKDGRPDIIFWIVGANDPCSPCKPGDVVIIDIPGQPGSYRSAGAIVDLLIERNRIFDMGLNGIGVVGFFDLATNPELIIVEEARIIGNVIRRCLQRELAVIAGAVQWFVGYGAIALAFCYRLLIHDNDLVANGPRHTDPVCGVFVLVGASITITNNRIEENGRRTEAPSAQANVGYRSGIHIGLAFPDLQRVGTPDQIRRQAAKAQVQFDGFLRMEGSDALVVHDNTVTQPLGRSLTALAIGHVSVADNSLTSRGIPGRDLTHLLVPNVLLLGLGASNELGLRAYLRTLQQMGVWLSGKDAFLPAWLNQMCAEIDHPEDPELFPGHLIPSSKVKFVDNRCALDLMAEPAGFMGAPIFAASTDDLAFGSNQCEADIPLQLGFAQAALAGMSVRVFDNRFAETRRHVVYSGAISGLMNTTTNNQSTHCLLVSGPVANTVVNTGNRALIEVFCGLICNRD